MLLGLLKFKHIQGLAEALLFKVIIILYYVIVAYYYIISKKVLLLVFLSLGKWLL